MIKNNIYKQLKTHNYIMNKAVLLIPLIIILFSFQVNIGESSTQTMWEVLNTSSRVFIYNSHFHGTKGCDSTLLSIKDGLWGWKGGTGTNAYYCNNALLLKFSGFADGIIYAEPENYTITITGLWWKSYGFTTPDNWYYLEFLNESGGVFYSHYLGSFGGSWGFTITTPFQFQVNASLTQTAHKIRLRSQTGAVYQERAHFYLNRISMFETNDFYENYNIRTNYQITYPQEDNKEYLSLSVPTGLKTDNNASTTHYTYMTGGIDYYNYTDGTFGINSMLMETHTDMYGFRHFSGGASLLRENDYSDISFYYVGLAYPYFMFEAPTRLSIYRLPTLASLGMIRSTGGVSENAFLISYVEPAKTTKISGIKTTYYEIFINKDGSLYKYYAFNDGSITSNPQEVGDLGYVYRVNVAGINYIFFKFYDFPENPVEYYVAEIRYSQLNEQLERVFSMSSTTDYLASYVDFKLYEYDEDLGMGDELNTFDYTNVSMVMITPNVMLAEDVSWMGEHVSSCTGVLYPRFFYPDDYFSPFVLNLCEGLNTINLKDTNMNLIKRYEINYEMEANLFNISIINNALNLVCFSNDSYSDCDFNKLIREFFVISEHDNPVFNIGDFNVVCQYEDEWDIFYSGKKGGAPTQWLPRGIETSSGKLISVWNIPYNYDTHSDFNNFLINNKDIINLNSYEFTKFVMNNYVKTLPSDKIRYYLPPYSNCVITETISGNSLNVSVRGDYNLYRDIKNSPIFLTISSSCVLNRFGTSGVFGELLQALDFLNYINYSFCLVMEFVADNSSTLYYIGFIIICVLISNILLKLFKI